MALKTTYSNLSAGLNRLAEAVRDLCTTLEDRPTGQSVALVDAYEDAAVELMAIVDNCLRSARDTRKLLPNAPRALAGLNAQTLRAHRVLIEKLGNRDRLDEVFGLANSLRGGWSQWAKAIAAGIERCREELQSVQDTLVECWQELAERISAGEITFTPGKQLNKTSSCTDLAKATPSQQAQDTIRRILGWRYRGDDAKGFTAALNKSFVLQIVEGHIEWSWAARPFLVQADLGEITGAQASLYARAKVALDMVLPLLDGLVPLRPDPDPEGDTAIRGAIRETLVQLVQELCAVGGPRVSRVDAAFKRLTGAASVASGVRTLTGEIKQLQDRFSLERRYVNTADDEQNLTNFLVLVDYLQSLFASWSSERSFFLWLQQPKPAPISKKQMMKLAEDLGCLVKLSQALDSLAASVQEAYDAMDSVFFGPAERQAKQIAGSSISVEDLLGWIESFATAEGPQLLQDRSQHIVGFKTAIQKLEDLVRTASAVGTDAARSSDQHPGPGQATVCRRQPTRPADTGGRTKVQCAWGRIQAALNQIRTAAADFAVSAGDVGRPARASKYRRSH